ncbi:MAG: pyridoxamine 5'-phosphate oxidase family protein [Clostridia bacterium]|nr:pyridoxamine 5'-phosphate oxidase family protein [Clostridia bacterium]
MFRSMRRPHLALTEAETWALLEHTAYGVLAINGTEGYPYAVPMNHAVINGALVFHAAVEGHRLEALRVDPRACFTVTEGPEENAGAIPTGTLGTYASAMVFGRVCELPPEQQGEALTAFVRKHLPERVGEVAQFLDSGRKVAVLRLDVAFISGKRLVVK